MGQNCIASMLDPAFDPLPSSLGQNIKKTSLLSYGAALEIFLENVNQLSEYAKAFGVSLLIENNVLSPANLVSL